jgi:DNA-binding transcriptional regulator LsrR (DeoR family)
MNGTNDLHVKKVKAVAYLHAQGYQNKQIAASLTANGWPTSEPQCANLLAEARREKLFWIELDRAAFSPAEVDSLRTLLLQPDLEPRLKRLAPPNTLKHLRIFYSGQEATTPASWNARLEHFAPLAAGRIWELLEGAATVGIGWGHTTAACVMALERDDGSSVARRVKQKPLRFVPTCGNPLGPASQSHPERASSAVVDKLHTMWGSRDNPLSLQGVCAVIPDVLEPGAKESVRQFVAAHADYQTIFGPSATPLVNQLDTLITSVGSFNEGWLVYKDELIRVGGIPRETLREVALGDIDGVLLPKSPLTASQAEEFNAMAGAWTGLTLQQCQRIAREAAHSGRPGVIVVAIGANKKAIVREVVQLGLVNELIIDHDLAKALGQEIPPLQRPRRGA